MATLPIPSQVVLALVLLPGYVLFRVALHFARFAGPVDWSEYGKAALSLVGSAALLAGTGTVFPGVVAVRGVGDRLAVVTDVTLDGYVVLLAVAVLVGAIVGRGFVVLYGRVYGLTRLRVDPREYLLRRLEVPVTARVVTDDREIVGGVRYTDNEGTPAVLSGPRLLTTRDGVPYRERMGRYAYVDPETVESVHFGSPFKPEAERGGLPERVWQSVRSLVGADVASEAAAAGLETPGEREADPPVTVSEGPLDRAADRVSARGTVRNELDEGIEFVQIRVDFEDADGAIVGTAVDSFDRLGGGDAWRFEAAYATGDPEEVASYSVGWYVAPPL